MTDSLFIYSLLALNTLYIFLHIWHMRSRDQHDRDIIRALLSRDIGEFTHSKLLERPPAKEKKPEDELTPSDLMTDDQFSAYIKKQVKQ